MGGDGGGVVVVWWCGWVWWMMGVEEERVMGGCGLLMTPKLSVGKHNGPSSC
jgi:hypothetical protein